MPGPLMVAVPYILAALGGGTLWAWVTGTDDEWADADVFNSRMRQIHVGALQLGDLIAKCAPLKAPAHAADLASWKNFVGLWSQFYREIGKVTFAPSEEVIIEARSYASILAKWLDTYKALCGPLPTGLSPLNVTPQKKSTHWGTMLLWGVVIMTGGYVLAQYVKTRRG